MSQFCYGQVWRILRIIPEQGVIILKENFHYFHNKTCFHVCVERGQVFRPGNFFFVRYSKKGKLSEKKRGNNKIFFDLAKLLDFVWKLSQLIPFNLYCFLQNMILRQTSAYIIFLNIHIMGPLEKVHWLFPSKCLIYLLLTKSVV